MAWNLIRRNNGETIHTDYVEWMLDSAADISNGTEPGKSGRWHEWLTQARLV